MGCTGSENCFDPDETARVATPQHLPSVDGALGWGRDKPFAPIPEGRTRYRDRRVGMRYSPRR